MKDLVKIGLISACILVGGVVTLSVANMLTLPVRAVSGVAERTFNADNMIYNYEWFKRQVQDVKAIDQKINAAELALKGFESHAGDRANWKFDDRQEWSRLNNVLLGLTNQRAGMIAEYNAKTQMANRDLFRTGDLPNELF